MVETLFPTDARPRRGGQRRGGLRIGGGARLQAPHSCRSTDGEPSDLGPRFFPRSMDATTNDFSLCISRFRTLSDRLTWSVAWLAH